MATYEPPQAARGSVRHFLAHFGEMMLAMVVGMAVFGALFGAVLAAAGTSSEELLESAPEFFAFVLMFNMTVPMVMWMRHRGHSAARIAEMAGAMLVVCVAAMALLWASVIDSTAICGVECALMIPAMAAVMLARRAEYGAPAHVA